MIRKTIVAIFAHPDDEAFGPAGTLYKLAQDNDVYVLCATRGEAGEHHGGPRPTRMDEVRSRELKNSAEILGIKQVYFLGFTDGTLCNNLYHKLANKCKEKLDELKPDMLITYEPRGVSGHIDHVTVSMVSSYLFTKLDYIKSIHYYCLSEEQSWLVGDYFIYFPAGYMKDQIDHAVDISDVYDKKIAAMYAHSSQRADAERIIERAQKLPKREHFLVKNK